MCSRTCAAAATVGDGGRGEHRQRQQDRDQAAGSRRADDHAWPARIFGQRLPEPLRGDRLAPDRLHLALAVDHERLGHRVGPERADEVAVDVADDRIVDVVVTVEAHGRRGGVLVGDAEQRRVVAGEHLLLPRQQRSLGRAVRAPGREHVEHDDLAAVAGERDVPGRAEHLQRHPVAGRKRIRAAGDLGIDRGGVVVARDAEREQGQRGDRRDRDHAGEDELAHRSIDGNERPGRSAPAPPAATAPPCRFRIARSRGRSSVGRALASQAKGRGFEARRPLPRHARRSGRSSLYDL